MISFDTIPPAPDLLKAGKVQVLLGQKYFGWGSESVRLLADIKAGKMPPNPIIDSGVDVVTPANVDQYVDRLEGARETIAAGVSHAPGGSSGTGSGRRARRCRAWRCSAGIVHTSNPDSRARS